jgi:hypothetical protein
MQLATIQSVEADRIVVQRMKLAPFRQPPRSCTLEVYALNSPTVLSRSQCFGMRAPQPNNSRLCLFVS